MISNAVLGTRLGLMCNDAPMANNTGKDPEISPKCLTQIRAALIRWERDCVAAEKSGDLGWTTKDTYIEHANRFVRYLEGEYVPGQGR